MAKNLAIGLSILKKNMQITTKNNNEELTNNNISNIDEILNEYNLKNYKLDNYYNVWFHDANNNNFDIESFDHISKIETVKDYLIINEVLKKNYKMLLNGMFFIMKNDINPIWSDDANKDGGCISWKIDKINSLEYWCNFLLLFITNNLPTELNNFNITGISINPKKNCNIFKLWVGKDINSQIINNMNLSDKCLFNKSLRLYKSFKHFF